MRLKLTSDPASQLLGTGYSRFNWQGRITGLCKITGSEIQILAVVATNPGKGDFRKFVEEAKKEYRCIKIWHVGNSFLRAALTGYGFRPCVEQFCFGGQWESSEGFRWDRD